MKYFLAIVVFGLASAGMAGTAHAGECFASSSGNWNSPATWNNNFSRSFGCGAIPGPSDRAWIDARLFGTNNLTVTVPTGYSASATAVLLGYNPFNGRADRGNNTLTLSANSSSLSLSFAAFIFKSQNGKNLLNTGPGNVTIGSGPGTGLALCGTRTGKKNVAEVDVGNGTLTINGVLQVDAGSTSNNIIDQSAGSGTINLTGDFAGSSCTNGAGSPIVLTVNPGNSSTFNYSGANQTVLIGTSNVSYHNLTLSGSGTKTPNNDPTLAGHIVTGNFTLASGVTWAGANNNPDLHVQGDFSNSGTFTAGSGVYTFDGSTPQTLTGTTTFENMTMNNNAGFTLNNNVTVNQLLTFTSGVITTGTNKVIIPSGGSVTRSSGHVYGMLQKHIPTGNPVVTYEIGGPVNYDPVSLAFTNVTTAGDVTASFTASEHPLIATSGIDPASDVNGYWSLANSATVFANYSATFTFTNNDKDSGSHWNSFIVAQNQSGTWTLPSVGTRSNFTTQATGVTGFGDFAVGDPSAAPASFAISAASAASTCTPIAVTITALDKNGNPVVSYTGTIVITTTSGHGDWSLNTGAGTLTDPTADDGAAAYTYAKADNGTVILNFADTHADNLNISVSAGTVTSLSSLISFRDNAFVITSTDTQVTPVNTVVAGRPHPFNAALWTKDPSTGLCAINSRYTGTVALKAWITRSALDPGGIAPTIGGSGALPNSTPASSNLALTFTAGAANFTLNTSDVGKYSINLLDDSSKFAVGTSGNALPISGASPVMTVRPFGFAFSNIQAGTTANPGSTTPGGGVFTAAGGNFQTTVSAVLWQSGDPANGVPTGPISGHAAAPAYAWDTSLTAVAPYHPASGILGALANGLAAQATFAGGQATPATLQYSEVGSVTLQADATGYLGSTGVNVTGNSAAVGRFTPDHFAVTTNSPQFTTACAAGSFTYLDQPFNFSTVPVINLTAVNAAGATTRNYHDFTSAGGSNWWKLSNTSLSGRSYTETDTSGNHSLDLTSLPATTADPVIADLGNGKGSLTFNINSPGIAVKRNAPTTSGWDGEAPFNADISLSISVQDADGVAAANNPVTFSNIAFSNSSEMRYGRVALINAVGTELLPLPVPLQVQYYKDASSGFVVNTNDSCSSFASSDFTLSTGLPTAVTSVSVTNGKGSVVLSAPGAGNTGYADVTGNVSTWLQFDWLSTDANTTGADKPVARAVFGVFKGNDHQIYTRQNP